MLPRFSLPVTSPAVSAANLGLALIGLLLTSAGAAGAAPGFQALPGHIPAAVSSAQPVAPLAATHPVPLALTLPLHHQAELADLLHGLSNPSDPRYGHYLTPDQFAARFSPTQAEYAQVVAYARSLGFSVTKTHSNRTLLEVTGTASQVEKAFGLHLGVYRSNKDGRAFYAPDAEPQVPAALAPLVSGVVGLDNAGVRRPHFVKKDSPLVSPLLDTRAVRSAALSGPDGGLSPSGIKTAYNLNSVTQTGAGQTLGLFELDAYTPSDIAAYENQYGLPNVPLQNVAVAGGVSAPGNGAAEVTLDIELQAALAPNAAAIVVYEAPNTDTGIVAEYNQIATDNIAKEISTSWGLVETQNTTSVLNSENAAFQQMAAQGQSIYAASGDSGAYDDGSTLSVDDPASQPFMVGVGGTSLATNADGTYSSESTWNNNTGAGGGGVSTIWTIPSYQKGVAGSAASQGSTTYRNVPDVSLNADPNAPGYSIYFSDPAPMKGPGFYTYGGTSCAAPLWAGFTALVNQKRAASGTSLLGFANPPIYAAATSSAYAADFHDIADGSNNLYYPAVPGYDDATGWGSFNGANLLATLAPAAAVTSATINDTAGGIVYTGSWFYSSGRGVGDYSDDVHATRTNGDSISYTFTGTGISYITELNSDEGNVQVYIDGTLQSTVNCANTTRQVQQSAYGVSGLAAGSHTIKLVKVSGTYMLLDAFLVSPAPVSSATINDSASSVAYTGSWFASTNRGVGDYSDDVHATRTNGDAVSYTFTGTSISYVTETNSDEGTVQVYVDGTLQSTVNCATTSRAVQQAVYTLSGLTSGTHTIKLVKASGTYMVLDAFVVSPAPPTVTTVNDSASGFGYTGSWFASTNRGVNDYGNDVHATATNGDSASYTFTGTGISYITETYSDEGNVQVYIDGALKTTVNCATASRLTQQAVYTATGLAAGSHTIKLVKASGTYMLLDAVSFQ